MGDKLEQLIAAYEELEKKRVDPAVVSDPKEYARIAKEHLCLLPVREEGNTLVIERR